MHVCVCVCVGSVHAYVCIRVGVCLCMSVRVEVCLCVCACTNACACVCVWLFVCIRDDGWLCNWCACRRSFGILLYELLTGKFPFNEPWPSLSVDAAVVHDTTCPCQCMCEANADRREVIKLPEEVFGAVADPHSAANIIRCVYAGCQCPVSRLKCFTVCDKHL